MICLYVVDNYTSAVCLWDTSAVCLCTIGIHLLCAYVLLGYICCVLMYCWNTSAVCLCNTMNVCHTYTVIYKHEVNHYLRFNGHWTSAPTIASWSGGPRAKDKGKEPAWECRRRDFYFVFILSNYSQIVVPLCKQPDTTSVNVYQILALLKLFRCSTISKTL